MAMTINTNFASMNAQRNLTSTQGSLNSSLQRLSTGLRINSASDDAAGLQIANRMDSQVNGLKVAQRNANDGISMSQTAEGALQEYTNILQRMRDLSVQSKNGTNSDSDRAALDKEFQAMGKELSRIQETTTYGKGESLFEKLNTGVDFQVGADVKTVDASKLSKSNSTQAINDTLAKLGVKSDSAQKNTDVTAVETKLTALKALTDGTKSADITALGGKADAEKFLKDMGIDAAVEDGATPGTNVKITLATGGKDAATKLEALATAAKGLTEDAGTNGGVKLPTADADGNFDMSALQTAMTGAKVDTTAFKDPNVINVQVDSAALDTSKLGNVKDIAGSETAIKEIDAMIENVGAVRADLGATQNRFQSTINNLGNISENMSVAKGRIMDADIAAESANMTKQNTMMQAGITVLSQANQMPSMVSQLLR
ncbi:flagellin N-terminal helical domain-containing protein [Photobacterium sanguinicancri]|uniref:flagellin N-terminal helical domain-containing protein n=1 Tax=Photobacterium sanguinicancri TaxID=875932 RepID=UPI000788E06D|nr:flagellin [Photobacterium sanguinicancri]KXI22981.1 flagellin [Photobacterium sanguinicancri]